jgi:hypothetical protein
VAQPSGGLPPVIRPGWTACAGTDQPFAPIENRSLRTVAGSQLGGIGLDLMLAGFAPDDQPQVGRRSAAERRGRDGVRFHPHRDDVGSYCPWLSRITLTTAVIREPTAEKLAAHTATLAEKAT